MIAPGHLVVAKQQVRLDKSNRLGFDLHAGEVMLGTKDRLATLGLRLPDSLRGSAKERVFEPHMDLFLQGQPATEIFGILSGRVTLWRAGEEGIACTLLLLGKGELLGSVAVTQGTSHLTAATALDRVVAVAWSVGCGFPRCRS